MAPVDGGFCFPRALRLGKNRNYRYVYRKGKSFPARSIVLIFLRAKELKIGFSVSGKVGNAVVRNRVRRRLREDVRLIRPRLKCGKYIFVARTIAARATHQELTREMGHLLRKAGLTQ